MQQVKVYSNGWSVDFGKERVMYSVILRDWSGRIYDKMRCDDYRNALAYRRAFMAIAKQGRV